MVNKPTVETTVYACGYCGKLWRKKEDADMCHMDRTCDDCGVIIEKKSYYTLCDSCRIKKEQKKTQDLYDKAIKISYEDYMGLYPDYPVVYNDVFYFDDLDYLLEKCEDEGDSIPKWVWGTKLSNIKLDPYDIIQQFEENVELDDYEMNKSAVNEIVEFCRQWNEKHSQNVYYEDNSVIVLLEQGEYR